MSDQPPRLSLLSSIVRRTADDYRTLFGASEYLQDVAGDFDTYCGLKSLLFARFICLIGAIGLLSFRPTDYWLFRDNARLFDALFVFRCASGLVFLSTYGFLQSPWMARFNSTEVVTVTFLALSGAIFLGVSYLGGPENHLFFQAIFVPSLVSTFLFPLTRRIVVTVASCLIIAAAYYLPHLSYLAHPDNKIVVVMVLADAVAVTIVGHIVYRLERLGFERRRESQAYAVQLEEVNRLKDSFVATVSHELRTPLNAIIGLTDAVLDEPLSPEVRRYARTIHESGEVLLLLINDLLDMAKLKAGKMELESAPVSLQDLVEAAASSFSLACQRKNLQLSWFVPTDLPAIVGDAGRLNRILFNLIGNAVKFTEAGEVQIIVDLVRTSSEHGDLTISVLDTGAGIPPEKRESIFLEFTQVDASITRRFGGTGLGLPIVRQLARLMGGDAVVAENAPRGSVFALKLPVTLAVAPPRTSSKPLRAVGGPVPLVVVGVQHPLRRRQTAGVLTYMGMAVELASSLDEVAKVVAKGLSAGRPVSAVVLEDPAVTPDLLKRSTLVGPDGRANVPLILVLNGPTTAQEVGTWRDMGIEHQLHAPVRRLDLKECLQRILDVGPLAIAPTPVPPPRRSPGAQRALARPAEPGRRKRVLVVDDMPENRLLVEVFAKQAPVSIVFAENGQEAVDRFIREEFDLVFLDIEMPVMDGYTAVRAIRAWETKNGRSPTDIVAMTAHSTMADHARTNEAGFTHHLAKPIRKQEFLRVLEAFGAEPAVAHSPLPALGR